MRELGGNPPPAAFLLDPIDGLSKPFPMYPPSV
jgi:hypothetical protein